MKDLATIKKLLLIIVIPLIVYLLKLLSFIFIPLVLALFIALVFMPFMRWMTRKKIPQWGAVVIVILIVLGGVRLGAELVKISSNQVLSTDETVWVKITHKIDALLIPIQESLGLETPDGKGGFQYLLKSEEGNQFIYQNFGSTFKFVRQTITMILLTIFFTILILAGSLNVPKILQSTIFKKKYTSVKTFLYIEKSISQFIKVKTFISIGTGLGFGLTAWLFGIKFALLWGLLAFVINYIQFLGSIIVTIALSVFAYSFLGASGSWFLLILILIGIQLLFGSVLEPVWMGETFKINTVTVLVMLMLWGFIWNIPGLILSIPITVFIKTLLEQFPKTKVIADIMS